MKYTPIASENNPFSVKKIIRYRDKLVDISSPKIMGIVNLTPDSFYAGSRINEKNILTSIEKMINEGVDIVDIGAVSSRPGADEVDESTERSRMMPILMEIIKFFPELILSVDTFRASIAREVIEAGAHIINDITSGKGDNDMFETIAELKVPYIIMHMQGNPRTMQGNPEYEHVTQDILKYFSEKISVLQKKGVADIIVDPGFGFGKTAGQNFQLLKELEMFRLTGCPVLIGISRKSMINKVINTKPEKALNGTSILHAIGLLNGASLLRVHDVKEAKEAIQLVEYYKQIKTES